MSRNSRNIGLTSEGKLTPCPDSPNCVSSFSGRANRRLAPLAIGRSPKQALDRLERLVLEIPRTRIVTRQPNYLHVEFRSRLFGFIDDVEFLVAPTEGCIHFRSASRIGYSDLGANRRRMESIQEAWQSMPGEDGA